MKEDIHLRLGKYLMKKGRLRICIVDDEAGFFNEQMLDLAAAAGFSGIERYYKIDADLFSNLLKKPPDILLLDIVGTTEEGIARDGFDIAGEIFKRTRAYVAITSSQQFFLRDVARVSGHYDYIISDRLLTAVDFIGELAKMVEDYITRKSRFYEKTLFKVGFKLAKRATLHGVAG